MHKKMQTGGRFAVVSTVKLLWSSSWS
jgi:hypothetical protein